MHNETTVIKMQELHTMHARHWLGDSHTHVLGWSEAAIDINRFAKRAPLPLRKEIKARWLRGDLTIHTCYTRERRGVNVWLGFDQLLAYSSRKCSTTNPTDYFVCQNYTPRQFRSQLIQMLHQRDLLSQSRTSWRDPTKPAPGVEDTWLETTPVEQFELPPAEQCLPPPVGVWSTTAFNLITETVVPYFPITEKTWQAIWQQRPFVVVGAVHTHRNLQAQGYVPLLDIDYAFDSIEDNTERMIGLVQQLEILLHTYTPTQIHQRNRKAAKHNRKLLARQVVQTGLPDVLTANAHFSPGATGVRDYMQGVFDELL
jgi:hypothetical protein